MAQDLPRSARVVIVGGGVVGCSVAYHLARAGVADVVLLERRELTCGTTWHAAGLIGQLRPSKRMTELAKYTAELYTGLEAETGQATGFKQNGSISLATHQGRFDELKRSASMAKVFDLRVDVLGPEEIKERYPLINVDDVVGGIFIPSDGQANPIDVTRALAKGARERRRAHPRGGSGDRHRPRWRAHHRRRDCGRRHRGRHSRALGRHVDA